MDVSYTLHLYGPEPYANVRGTILYFNKLSYDDRIEYLSLPLICVLDNDIWTIYCITPTLIF